MDWEAIGAIGEVVGAISVLITVLYLAIQIKESAKAQQTVSTNSMIEGYNSFITWCVSTEELAKTSQRMFKESNEELTPLDAHRLASMYRVFTNHITRLFHLRQAGVLPQDTWVTVATEAKQILNLTEFGRKFKQNNLAYADVWDAIDELESQELSKF